MKGKRTKERLGVNTNKTIKRNIRGGRFAWCEGTDQKMMIAESCDFEHEIKEQIHCIKLSDRDHCPRCLKVISLQKQQKEREKDLNLYYSSTWFERHTPDYPHGLKLPMPTKEYYCPNCCVTDTYTLEQALSYELINKAENKRRNRNNPNYSPEKLERTEYFLETVQ